MREDSPDMKLRLAPELRQKIEQAAKQNNRSLNGEIAARLEVSFAAEARTEPNRGASIANLGSLPEEPFQKAIIDLQKRVAFLESLVVKDLIKIWESEAEKEAADSLLAMGTEV
jgi:hypothetical protein